MKIEWEKTGVEAGTNGERTITYSNPKYPEYVIQSRKRNISHANGIGHWSHTTYVVIHEDEKTFYSLRDAITWVARNGGRG